MKRLIIVIALIHLCSYSFAQELRKAKLLKSDILNNVILRYEYVAKDKSSSAELLLKKNGTYAYGIESHLSNSISQGVWKKSKNIFTFTSYIQEGSLPISIKYCNEQIRKDSFNISVVKNINGEFIPAYVFVNTDSIKCDPSLGLCNKDFTEINQIKVVLENGLSSKWIKVNEPKEKLIVTIMTEVDLSKYIVMKNVKYLDYGNLIKKISP